MRKQFAVLSLLTTGVFLVGMLAASAAQACDCPKAKTDDCPMAKAGKAATASETKVDNKAEQKPAAKAPKAFDKAPAVGTKATCPVMGGELTVTADTTRSEYKGKHYVFCCPGCKPKFDAEPDKYTK